MNTFKIYRCSLALGLACAVSALTTPCWSQLVVRVEEDWELVVGTPDADSVSPQITCAFAPLGDISGLHATFEVNHQSQPYFAPGGLQLQVWDGWQPVASVRSSSDGVMRTSGETVRWTQAVELNDGMLTFEIVNGSSTTWGSFGGDGSLGYSMPAPLLDLATYSPAVSAENSGVGYAQHRVKSLVLKEVRLVLSTGVVLVDSTPRVVHEH